MLFTLFLGQQAGLLMNELADELEPSDTRALPQAKPPSEHCA